MSNTLGFVAILLRSPNTTSKTLEFQVTFCDPGQSEELKSGDCGPFLSL